MSHRLFATSVACVGLALVGTLVASVALAADAPAPARVSVPDKPALAAAEKLIRDLFKVEFASKKPADRAEFSKKLLAQALESGNDPAAQYVLFDQSLTIAVSLGEVETALRASEQMARRFKVDGLAQQDTLLTDLSRTVRTSEGAQALLTIATTLMNRAVDADDYDSARKMATLAMTVARKSQNAAATSQLQTRVRQIDQLKKDYDVVKGAIATLATDPNDAAANLAMGKFLALSKEDLEGALPYLAKGSEATLASLARRDLANPTDPESQVKLADAWWEAGEKMQEEPLKVLLAEAAGRWYSAALPSLKGLARTQVEAKLKSMESKGGGSSASKTRRLVQALREQCGFRKAHDDYGLNDRGHAEKYLRGKNDVWYYLLPNGELYEYSGSDAAGTPLQGKLIAKLGRAYYDNPSLLHEPTQNQR